MSVIIGFIQKVFIPNVRIYLEVSRGMRKRIITFKVPDRMLKEMNQMMDEGNFDSRSELVRAALAEFIVREYFMGNVPEDKADLFSVE